jgi:hypothetical protein
MKAWIGSLTPGDEAVALTLLARGCAFIWRDAPTGEAVDSPMNTDNCWFEIWCSDDLLHAAVHHARVKGAPTLLLDHGLLQAHRHEFHRKRANIRTLRRRRASKQQACAFESTHRGVIADLCRNRGRFGLRAVLPDAGLQLAAVSVSHRMRLVNFVCPARQ